MRTRGSWLSDADGSGFDVDHLPYGVFSSGAGAPRVGVRIGGGVLAPEPLLRGVHEDLAEACAAPGLNPLMALGPPAWRRLRAWLVDVLTDASWAEQVLVHLHHLDDVVLHLPFEVADYVDFYASEHHATNVGRIFRPDAAPLLPNWKHLPVGYHGRAGTVVVSGTGVVRPHGQRKEADDPGPTFGPSRRLDLEAELGFVVGVGSALGTSVAVDGFAEHVFGVVLLNDWSARDVQAWEYVPLGPFLGKSFATSVSAWVTPLDALDAAWCELPVQEPAPLPYLRVDGRAGLDLDLEVEINGSVVSRPGYASMYWSPAQMLAHATVNGASLRTGDLFGSGTVSGPTPDARGSLLELSWGGREPVRVGTEDRTFLEDGDEVVLRCSAPGSGGGRLALGEVRGRVLPARTGAVSP